MAFEDKAAVTAKRLKELRVENKLSHERLALALSEKYNIRISKDSLINFEKGEKQFNNGMKTEYLRCFADYYAVSADYLLGITDEPIPESNIQSVCQYTGLSGATLQTLHSFDSDSVERNFIKRFLDTMLERPEYIGSIVEWLWQYVDAQRVAEMQRFNKATNLNSKNRAPIYRDGYFVIPAVDAASDYLSYAVGEANASIYEIIENMAKEMLHSGKSKPNEETIDPFRWKIYSEAYQTQADDEFAEFLQVKDSGKEGD